MTLQHLPALIFSSSGRKLQDWLTSPPDKRVISTEMLDDGGVELGQFVGGDGFDEAIEASSWGQHDNIFTLIEPVGRDLDGRGFRLQRGLVPTDDGEELTQVRHRDGGGSEAQIW